MQLTLLKGYPDYVGKRFMWAGYGNGPSSYVFGVGDPIVLPRYENYIDSAFPAMSVSGNYIVQPQPTGVGTRQTWNVRWLYTQAQGLGVDGVVIASAGSGQTAGTYTANASGGGGTGAVLQYVISGGALTGVKVISPGTGYTSVPTFTIAAGGTPGTVTATIGAIAGIEVGSGTNLSAELIQLAGFGGQF